MNYKMKLQVPAAIVAIAQERVDTVRIIFQYKFNEGEKTIRKYADYSIVVSTRGKYISKFVQLMKATLYKDKTYEDIYDEFNRLGSIDFNRLLGKSVKIEFEVEDKNGTTYHNMKQVLPIVGEFKPYRDFPLSRKFFNLSNPDGPIDIVKICQLKDTSKYEIREVNELIMKVK